MPHTQAATLHEHRPLIACEMCGAIYRRHALAHGEKALCRRCDTVLWRYSRLDAHAWLALTVAGLLVYGIANAFPIASLAVQGVTRQATLADAIAITWQHGYPTVAVMAGLTALALPLLQILALLWVLGPLAAGRLAPGFPAVMRLLGLLRPWCMVPVFLLGVLVAVVKLVALARLEPGAGLLGFAGLTVFSTLLSRLSPHQLWRMAERAGVIPVHDPVPAPGTALGPCHVCGQVQALPLHDPEALHRCVRCDAHVHLRKPDTMSRTWALVLTAGLLYIPANVLPVMQITTLFGTSNHTILGGVIDLWRTGSWDLAVIVFIASVAVPITKLLSLAVLLISVQRAARGSLPQRTRLYRLVELIGQWSMLDIYVVVLLGALARFQGLMQISAGPGATAFGLVVVLTMLAAMSFDPRRTWDRAGAGAPSAQPAHLP
ncbi:PqiA/YebS family transporter subunit [Verticiella sediminum]|uniref:PqiA/YebS family transporter subunit n=1 Tax=Verticiella sediminum TaxID=1247510 RepID=A0A556A877_9BURK|nr:PqiA/YebS family transporter subunit [Verticiella sediminum]TSH89087.1 PqiA/YebS family transporter subunit [Verticiella sediminum]